MNIILYLVNFIIHIDEHLGTILRTYGTETYLFIFLIIFCETGLVIMPFLPGDSLIFAAGAFAAMNSLNVFVLYFVLLIAAFLGDTVNYHIGKKLSNKIENLENRKIIKKEHFDKTQEFFNRHGGKSIVLARFMPILRTFVPFVAGSGKMDYIKFLKYNLFGSILWVTIFTAAGFFFGNISFVKERFSLVIILVIALSLLPILITYIVNKLKNNKASNIK
ncbi:MAG: DedA family protein [Clostridia bacterium]|nr:DedA family protein [Clostridia bacterium]